MVNPALLVIFLKLYLGLNCPEIMFLEEILIYNQDFPKMQKNDTKKNINNTAVDKQVRHSRKWEFYTFKEKRCKRYKFQGI